MTTERKGEIFIFFEAVLWGLFPVITILSLHNLPTLISLCISTIFASIFFGLVVAFKNKWYEVKNKSALKDICILTILITLYYFLYFLGLQYTSAGNGSLVALTEIFFSFLLFNIWKKDYMPKKHILGAILMVLGAIIVLLPNTIKFQIGDFFVLLAALVAPFGNYFQKSARRQVSSETIMFLRSSLSSAGLLILILLFHKSSSVTNIENVILFLVINGVLLLGLSKYLWIEGIYRLNITKAISLGSTAPLITLLFAWILLHNSPTVWQLLAFIPMFCGVILLSTNQRQTK